MRFPKGGRAVKNKFVLLLLIFAVVAGPVAMAQTPPPASPPPATPDEKAPTCNAGFYLTYVDGQPTCQKMPTECTQNIYGETYCRPCKSNEAMTYVDGKYKCLAVPKCGSGEFLFSDGTKFECKAP